MNHSKALNLLKENVIKPGSAFHKNLENRFSFVESTKDGCSMFIEEETVTVAGTTKTIRRIFVQSATSDYGGVGWVINEDITSCMVCGTAFGMFRWPHHCRSCGNIVCHPCSPEVVEVVELKELGAVRVCCQCYWGQDPVHVTFQRKLSTTEVPEDDLIMRQRSMALAPVFAVNCRRKLSEEDQQQETGEEAFMIVHVCLHDVMMDWPDERDFIICEACERSFDEKMKLTEIFHVVLRADIISNDISLKQGRIHQVSYPWNDFCIIVHYIS
jgi:hypothetical protein